MKKNVIVALVALAMSAGVAFAARQQNSMGNMNMGGQMRQQQAGRMNMNIDRMVSRMKTRLNLTDKQTDQVRALYEKQEQDMRSWRADHPNATRSEIQEHRRDMMTSMRDQLKQILTPEQYQKEQQYIQQQMRRRGMMNRGPAQKPPQN